MDYFQKLLIAPQESEIIFTAAEELKLGALNLNTGLKFAKIASLLRKRGEVFDSLATFNLPAGTSQRDILGVLPANFSMEAGEELSLSLTPPISEQEDWVGIQGYAYSPVGGSTLPAGITEQLTTIEDAIGEVDLAIDALPSNFEGKLTAIQTAIEDVDSSIEELPSGFEVKLTAIQNAIAQLPDAIAAAMPTSGNGGGGNSSDHLTASAKEAYAKLLSRSNNTLLIYTGYSSSVTALMWRTAPNTDLSEIVLGNFTLASGLVIFVGGNTWSEPALRQLQLLDSATNEILIQGNLDSFANSSSAPVPGYIPTPGISGRSAKLKIIDTSNQWVSISPFIIPV